jgi:hypothetical protein
MLLIITSGRVQSGRPRWSYPNPVGMRVKWDHEKIITNGNKIGEYYVEEYNTKTRKSRK